MNVLLLGGTGAMGVPLSKILLKKGFSVYVTSRKQNGPISGIEYLQGNAQDDGFFYEVLERKWDVIIDFMAYPSAQFSKRMPSILDATQQYIFISSARVYSESLTPITEETPRLLETTTDSVYLNTDEYALSKARQENSLRDSGKNNWTIIRPSITFNESRLQLGVLEKESWLYRALKGRSIVFSEDIANKVTAMTHGDDVSIGIANIVGEQKALGEAFHITSEEAITWQEVLNIYLQVLYEELGTEPKVIMTEKSLNLNINKYQVIYSRYFNRRFDNKKIKPFVDIDSFQKTEEAIRACLKTFLNDKAFNPINWRLEAMNDKASREFTPLEEIPSLHDKIVYLAERFSVTFALEFAYKVNRFLRNK
ncbi:NAD(P)H-binding protein [Glaciecola sp. 2405UD65-10]|uniref:NAD(P)H-binding protein n=1 Tax=Glaciecola sp. 2405UD65-10 TaxID=3397244 RepID=UPI003B5B3128